MARALNKLSVRRVASLKKRGRYADGGGLYLLVDAKGAKQWTFRFQISGRRSELGLGGLNSVSLADARKRATQLRSDLAYGRDPLLLRREAATNAKQAAEIAHNKQVHTFAAVADATISMLEHGWRNQKHRAQWRSTLHTYAAALMEMDVSEIKTEHVLNCLEPIWLEKPETASRVRGRIETVLNAARARDFISQDQANPARWRGHLEQLLPKRIKLSRGHHAALPWARAPDFVGLLRQREAKAARMLEFAILTAARSGEVRGLRWDEVDIGRKIWTIPAERMKTAKEHRIPLSEAALRLLENASAAPRSKLVFPGAHARMMSGMAFRALFNRMGIEGITAHGFRSTFRDWAGDATDFGREEIEAALAHRLKDRTEAAYRRGDALKKRRALMEAWAEFLASPGNDD